MSATEDHFRLLCAAAVADGELAEAERFTLVAAAKRLGLTLDRAATLLRETRPGAALRVETALSSAEAEALVMDMARAAGADVISERERKLIVRVGVALGLTEARVEMLLSIACSPLQVDILPSLPEVILLGGAIALSAAVWASPIGAALGEVLGRLTFPVGSVLMEILDALDGGGSGSPSPADWKGFLRFGLFCLTAFGLHRVGRQWLPR